MKKSISELRQDIVSGDWVVIATGRGKRPDEFSQQKKRVFRQPKETCPFETLHDEVSNVYTRGLDKEFGKWWVQVIPNKYPAFGKGECGVFTKQGPYEVTQGVGFHEVVITQDHDRSIARMTDEETELIIRAYQDRFLAVKDDACVEYVSIFHNHGPLAGASMSHPHSQIIAIPVVPPDVGRSLEGSLRYYGEHHECVHCTVISYELKEKKRIIYQNDSFVAIAPFASRSAFEVRIFPKRHTSRFEEIGERDRKLAANALRLSLAKMYQGLNNPDYNFFLHTAPTDDGGTFSHYHWHFEIVPKTAIWAGFEIGTGIEISAIAPEVAAAFLRKVKV